MIRASSILFWFGLAIAASLAMYHTSYRVQELNHQLRGLNTSIESEQKSIHVLKAEWVFLANPSRVETEAKRHLALRPTAAKQVARLEDLSAILPTRKEAMGSTMVSATPIPSVKTSLAVPARQAPARTKVASAKDDDGHVNTRMVIQRTASAEPLPDSIDSLMARLDLNQ